MYIALELLMLSLANEILKKIKMLYIYTGLRPLDNSSLVSRLPYQLLLPGRHRFFTWLTLHIALYF